MDDPGYYYCCLNPAEQGVFRATALGLPAVLFVGIPLEAWNVFWLPYGLTGAARRTAFLHLYGLEIVTIVIGDPPVPVEVVRPVDLSRWVGYSLFIATPAAACIDGCRQSQRPNLV